MTCHSLGGLPPGCTDDDVEREHVYALWDALQAQRQANHEILGVRS